MRTPQKNALIIIVSLPARQSGNWVMSPFEFVAASLARQVAASSRRTPRRLRHKHFQSSHSCPSADGHPKTKKSIPLLGSGGVRGGRSLVPPPPTPSSTEEGSHFQGSHSCPPADGRPETMKIPELTPHRNSPPPLPSPLGRGKRGSGERVRGIFRAAKDLLGCL